MKFDELFSARRKEHSPKRITDRHSSFTDLTPALRKGIQVRAARGLREWFNPTDAMMARNDWVYFVSRSCRR